MYTSLARINCCGKYDTEGEVNSVVINPNGRYVVAGTLGDFGYCRKELCGVFFFDNRGNLLWRYEANSNVESVAVSSDGEYIVAGTQGKVMTSKIRQ